MNMWEQQSSDVGAFDSLDIILHDVVEAPEDWPLVVLDHHQVLSKPICCKSKDCGLMHWAVSITCNPVQGYFEIGYRKIIGFLLNL